MEATMTAGQIADKWADYIEYKNQKVRANEEYLDYAHWSMMKDVPVGFSGANAPDVSAVRKATPIFSGVLRFFPKAVAAVARRSGAGNLKHCPGAPMQWAREKSSDHGDCIIRHQMEFDTIDPETGEYHAVAVAWRALAQLELLEEARDAGNSGH